MSCRRSTKYDEECPPPHTHITMITYILVAILPKCFQVFYDADGYMSDDSDAERDRQLSHLYSELNQNGAKDEKWKTIAITDKREELLPNNNQKIPIDKKDADGIEKTETTTEECTRHGESVKKTPFLAQ